MSLNNLYYSLTWGLGKIKLNYAFLSFFCLRSSRRLFRIQLWNKASEYCCYLYCCTLIGLLQAKQWRKENFECRISDCIDKYSLTFLERIQHVDNSITDTWYSHIILNQKETKIPIRNIAICSSPTKKSMVITNPKCIAFFQSSLYSVNKCYWQWEKYDISKHIFRNSKPSWLWILG